MRAPPAISGERAPIPGWGVAVTLGMMALGAGAWILARHGTPTAAPRDITPSEISSAVEAPSPSVCASEADVRSRITVTNSSAEPLAVWWVDRQCKEHPLGSIPGHGSLTPETYLGHPWRVRSAGSQRVVLDIPPARDPSLRTFTAP